MQKYYAEILVGHYVAFEELFFQAVLLAFREIDRAFGLAKNIVFFSLELKVPSILMFSIQQVLEQELYVISTLMYVLSCCPQDRVSALSDCTYRSIFLLHVLIQYPTVIPRLQHHQ